MLVPEAGRGNYSGESSPIVLTGVQTLCLGVTLTLQPHSIKTQKTLQIKHKFPVFYRKLEITTVIVS